MKDRMRINIEAILKKASESKISSDKVRSNKPSSLHQIIKTKEQAERFMKSLRDAK
jgi:hypothetical protein